MDAQVYQTAMNASSKHPEQQTEMANLSMMLGDNRRRLRDMLEAIELRLDSFSPRPPPLQGKPAEAAPEQMPGTLAGLRHMAETTAQDLSRLDAICMRLRDLL